MARNESLEWGVLRSGRVGISGTDYVPPIPERSRVEQFMIELLASQGTVTEKALTYFAWGKEPALLGWK